MIWIHRLDLDDFLWLETLNSTQSELLSRLGQYFADSAGVEGPTRAGGTETASKAGPSLERKVVKGKQKNEDLKNVWY